MQPNTLHTKGSAKNTHERTRRFEQRWDGDHIASGSVSPAAASCPDHTRMGSIPARRSRWGSPGCTHGVLVSLFVDVSLTATITPTIVVSYTFAYLSPDIVQLFRSHET